MKSHLTSCGIPGVGVVPYGLHMCHFYPSREELLDGLVPYFEAGLANNERCLWIASSPLPAAEIGIEIEKSPALARGAASGQLTILDAADWYGDAATLDPEAIVQRWIAEEERAIAAGYQGLRITGNTSFVPRGDWRRFMEYEQRLHDRLRDRRIVAFCSYSRQQCRPVDILEVARSHDAAVDRTDQHWHVFVQRTSPVKNPRG